MEEKNGRSGKEKPHPVSAEKTILSETEQELVLGIPLLLWLRPIVLEPQTLVIAIQVEHAQIAIGVGMCGVPSKSLPPRTQAHGCILYVIENHPVHHTKYFFLRRHTHPPRKAVAVRALNMHVPERSRVAVTARYNQTGHSIPLYNYTVQSVQVPKCPTACGRGPAVAGKESINQRDQVFKF